MILIPHLRRCSRISYWFFFLKFSSWRPGFVFTPMTGPWNAQCSQVNILLLKVGSFDRYQNYLGPTRFTLQVWNRFLPLILQKVMIGSSNMYVYIIVNAHNPEGNQQIILHFMTTECIVHMMYLSFETYLCLLWPELTFLIDLYLFCFIFLCFHHVIATELSSGTLSFPYLINNQNFVYYQTTCEAVSVYATSAAAVKS